MNYSDKENANKNAIRWLTGAHFINDTYSGFLNPIMPFVAAKVGFTMVTATMIMCVAQICASLTQPIFGFFADNINKRIFIFWGMIAGSLFVPLAVNMPNVYLITICVILGNLGGSFFHPQAFAFVSRYTDKKIMHNMSVFIVAGTVGFAIGPFLSSAVGQYLGFSYISYLSIVGVLFAFTMFKYVPRIPDSASNEKHKDFIKSFKEILSNKSMLILIVISMMKSLITSSCAILLPFLWKNVGYKPAYIGTALFLFLLAGGLGSLVSSKFEAKFGAKFVFYCSMILTFPLMFVFLKTYQDYRIFSLGIFVIIGFITMFAQPVTMVMAQKVLPEHKSIVSGFINGFTWGVVAVILTVLSVAAENIGIAKILIITSFVPVIFSYFVRFLPDMREQ